MRDRCRCTIGSQPVSSRALPGGVGLRRVKSLFCYEVPVIPARLRWLWLTLTVVLADRLSKAWFESQTVEG